MNSRILLRGGMVADGIGATLRRADILTEGPVIAAAGDVPAPPGDCEVISLAPGSVVCPGFIDAHIHAEGPLLASGRVDGALAQGVTTLVVGQDGQSFIGASAATARYLNQYFGPVNGRLEPPRDFGVAAFGRAVSGRLAQNVAVLASQGTIRHNVVGMRPGPLAPGELAAARQQVETALAEGAAGLSSGMDYLPSRFGGVAEVAAMAAPLAAAGRPYVSHLRGYGPAVKDGLDELVEVGRTAGVAVHASHLWGTLAGIEAALADAGRAGVAVTFDMYPYRRSSTILASLLLPPELQASGPTATLAALADPAARARLLATEKFTDSYLGNVYLGALPDHAAQYAGLSVAQAAAQASQPAGEWVLSLLAETGLDAGGHLHRPTLTSEDLAALMRHDRHAAGSDGIYQGQRPHPRGYGTFARLAGYYLVDGPGTGYQRLARHLAVTAADAFGLAGRGRLAPGMAADICVIGPSGMSAPASYGEPRLPATGVDLVLVNGTIVWKNGSAVADRFPGRLVA